MFKTEGAGGDSRIQALLTLRLVIGFDKLKVFVARLAQSDRASDSYG